MMKPHGTHVFKNIFIFLLGAALALAAAGGYAALRTGDASGDGALVADNGSSSKRLAARAILPSVVSIAAARSDNKISSGSGFIIDARGYIVTNKHVIKDAKSIAVSLADKRRFVASVAGIDAKSDLAVLKISADGLVPARWGDSDEVEAGDDVLAVGNPFGYLSHTVTGGIISATGRDRIGVIAEGGAYAHEDFLQTDAIINPGNSGGPLVNMRGEVIGVNIAIISETGLAQKVGLAIPSAVASFVVTRLVDEGKVVRGLLGAAIMDVDYDLVRTLKLKDMKELTQKLGLSEPAGVYVTDVSGKPAVDAGLKEGDVILKFGETEVNDSNRFRLLVAMTRPGKTVSLTILRGGQKQSVAVTLGTQPEN